jgi:hypothetical protein
VIAIDSKLSAQAKCRLDYFEIAVVIIVGIATILTRKKELQVTT